MNKRNLLIIKIITFLSLFFWKLKFQITKKNRAKITHKKTAEIGKNAKKLQNSDFRRIFTQKKFDGFYFKTSTLSFRFCCLRLISFLVWFKWIGSMWPPFSLIIFLHLLIKFLKSFFINFFGILFHSSIVIFLIYLNILDFYLLPSFLIQHIKFLWGMQFLGNVENFE